MQQGSCRSRSVRLSSSSPPVEPIGFYNSAVLAHYYRPIFFLWLRLNFFVWGTHAWGWHLASIGLHVLVSVLVLWVLLQYFQHPGFALVGALIFAAHPAHVESVAWVSGCTDALMALGLLGSLYFWMRNCQAPSRWRRLVSLGCCAMALMAKETAIILPVVIFSHAFAGIHAKNCAHDATPGRLVPGIREAMPYVALATAYLMIRTWVLRGMPSSPSWISRAETFLTLPSLILFYGSHLFWPSRLSLFYDLPLVRDAGSALFWLPLIVICGILAGLCLWYRRTGELRIVVAGLWFLLPLLPILYIRVFPEDDWVHDRYLYVPVLALSVLAGMVAEFLSTKELHQRAGRLPLLILYAAVVFLGMVTVVQARPWKNNLTLYTNAVRLAPDSMLARNNLATEYISLGRYTEASDLLASILKDRPRMWLANYNYAYVNYRLGRLSVASDFFCRAIHIDPNDSDQYLYLGATYLKEGRLATAAEQVNFAIARRPNGMGYHFVLGVIQLQQGNLVSAKEEMQKELTFHPESASAQTQLQMINRQLARNPE